jgi:Bax protein
MQGFIKVSALCILLVALAAPFTFLKPIDIASLQQKTVDSVKEKSDANGQSANKKPAKPKIIEKPLHDVILPNFAEISDISTKKQQFFDFIRPAIVKHNQQLLSARESLEYFLEQITLEIGLTDEEALTLQTLVKKYRVSKQASSLQQIDELLSRVDIIPVSLVLVQAANESAWGTSRFARIGLNFFGIWCYQPKCGMVPSGRNVGAKHEVAAFSSIDDAVSGYFNNINTHNAYYIFRTIRAQLRAHNQPLSPSILATGLLPYSERGADYVVDITDMLRHNQSYFTYENEYDSLGE